MTRTAVVAKRVVTCDPGRATDDNPLGAFDDGAVVHEAGRIIAVGPRAELENGAYVVDLGDATITPGLVDAHTHAAWMGSRHHEYAMRMRGADYRDIAAAGGGILASHRAIVAASEENLALTLEQRLRRMAKLGVTTCEVKSGYGLLPDEEKKQLRAVAECAKDQALPFLVPTFLALHALPKGVERSAYVVAMCELSGEIAEENLARFVDAYVDAHAFTVDEARALGQSARAAGLGIRLHVGQFADVGGAELAAELGALSADHLEHVSADGARALADAGTFAVLLPSASFTLGQAPPPIALFREAGVRLVVASDSNPGTAPTESLPLALALAVRLYGLSPAEAILGATRHAALSLAEPDRGVLRAGAHADIVGWDLPHEEALVQPWGTSRTLYVLRDGCVLHTHAG